MRGGWVGMNRSHSGRAYLRSNLGLTWGYGRWLGIFALSRGPLARFSEYLSAVFADHCGTGLHALCPQHLVDRVKGSASAPQPFDQVVVRFESGKCLASPGSKLLQERIKLFRGNLVHRSDICGERLMGGLESECGGSRRAMRWTERVLARAPSRAERHTHGRGRVCVHHHRRSSSCLVHGRVRGAARVGVTAATHNSDTDAARVTARVAEQAGARACAPAVVNGCVEDSVCETACVL